MTDMIEFNLSTEGRIIDIASLVDDPANQTDASDLQSRNTISELATELPLIDGQDAYTSPVYDVYYSTAAEFIEMAFEIYVGQKGSPQLDDAEWVEGFGDFFVTASWFTDLKQFTNGSAFSSGSSDHGHTGGVALQAISDYWDDHGEAFINNLKKEAPNEAVTAPEIDWNTLRFDFDTLDEVEPNIENGDQPDAYFSFLGAYPDGFDPIQRLGDTGIGFEDMGELDYNDLIVTEGFDFV